MLVCFSGATRFFPASRHVGPLMSRLRAEAELYLVYYGYHLAHLNLPARAQLLNVASHQMTTFTPVTIILWQKKAL